MPEVSNERLNLDPTSEEQVEVEALARALAALADPTRLRIVGLLATGERTGVEVAAALGISQALACHHLTRLAESGLIRQRRAGQSKANRLDAAALERCLALVKRTAEQPAPTG